MAVRSAFQDLLSYCGNQFKWTFIAEWKKKKQIKYINSIDNSF